MKKVLILVVAVTFVVFAASAFADVTNSKHNLSSTGTLGPKTNAAGATVCGFCHIPHGGDTTITGVPLWARNLVPFANKYIPYGGTAIGGTGLTLNGTTVNQPSANSLTCLSCHDGTVGLGVTFKNDAQATNYTMIANGGFVTTPAGALDFAGYAGSANPAYNPVIAGSAGTDLTNDHPVGVDYVVGRAGLGAVPASMKVYGPTSRVECASCHDPHVTTNGSFLRAAKANFCQACHVDQ